MFKYWPVTNPNKEVLFLNELEEVIIIFNFDKFIFIIDSRMYHK